MDKIYSKMKSDKPFESISKTLRPLKAIAKVIGIILVFFGFLVFVLAYATTYLDLPDPDKMFIIISAVGYAIFGGGLFLCYSVTMMTVPNAEKVSNYLDHYYKDKEKPTTSTRFYSFRWSRLIAAAMFLILGFLDLTIITGAIGHHNMPYGTAVVLGGPSFYYLIGFFPQGFGLGLLLYVFFKSHRAHVGKSDNYFYYNEFNKNTYVNLALPKEDIELISYQNNRIGKNNAWIITLVPFIVLEAINGVYFLRTPLLENPIEGILFLVTAGLKIIALFYLAQRPAHYLKISTEDNHYETWMIPHKTDLTEFPFAADKKGKTTSEFMKEQNISSTHRNYTRLLIGLFFLISGLIMITFYYALGVFGGLYTMSSIIFGAILILHALIQDFSDKEGVLIDFNRDEMTLRFQQTRRTRFNQINTLQPTEVEITKAFRKINIFVLLVLPFMLFYSTVETVLSWAVSSSSTLIWNSVITTIFLISIYFLIFVYFCVPTPHLRFETASLQERVPITLTTPKSRFFKGVLSPNLKKGFLMRCAYIAGIGITALIYILIYMNQNLLI